METQPHTHSDKGSLSGFTLIEMLVAVAIFTIVLGGVVLLFNNAVRVTKQGYQNQEAYSMVRGVANRIETDITAAHAALEHGLGDTFYGSPIGFTFIGKIKTGEGLEDYDLARITYVIYMRSHASLTKIYEEANISEDELQFEEGYDPPDNLHLGIVNPVRGNGSRVTFSLLRFVEPNVDNLDTFQDVDWSSSAFSTNPESGSSFDDVIGFANDVRLPNYWNSVTPGENLVASAQGWGGPCSQGDFLCAEAVEKAARREYWLRLLAGDPALGYDWWGRSGRDPADYAIAEDILHISRHDPYTPNDRDTIGYIVNVPDGRVEADPDNNPYPSRPDENHEFLDPNHIALIARTADQYEAYERYRDYFNDNYLVAKLDLYDQSIEDDDLEEPYSPRNYFFTYRAMGVTDRLNDTNEKIVAEGLLGGTISYLDSNGNPPVNEVDRTLYEQEVRGVDFAYWNDYRNLMADRIKTWYAYLPEEDKDPNIERDVIFAAGSPTDGRLPEAIIGEFTIYMPSVYQGAPDFQRTFIQKIDMPVGHKRPLPTSEQDAIRHLDERIQEQIYDN